MNDGDQTGPRQILGNYVNYTNLGYHVADFDFDESGFFDPMKANRIGEAKHPGPFVVSCLNIQSLNAAVNESRLEPPVCGLLALSETSATQVGIDKAGKFATSHRCHAFHSKPSGYRNYARGIRSEARGEATGTWAISSNHIRPVQMPWPEDVWNLSRTCDSIVFTECGPVYVACVYGLHQCLPDSYATTDRILEVVFHRAEQMQMPAIICGDLNAPLHELTTWESMQLRDWADAAVVQSSRDGMPPRNTYKESTRIDYILMNKFASRAFRTFWVSELPVTDHRQLYASFDWQKTSGLETIWKMPDDLRHAGLPAGELQTARVPVMMIHNFQQALRANNLDDAWFQWTTAMEHVANAVAKSQNGLGLMPRYKGKNRPGFVRRHASKPYVPRGRDDTLQTDAADLGVNFRERVKQVRRIDAYIAQLKHEHPIPPLRQEEAARIWRAILAAPGFVKGFSYWCLHELETPCPLDAPALQHAKWLRSLMAEQVPKWRAKAHAQRIKETRMKFHDDWTKGGRLSFQAIKPAQHPPVDAIDRVDRIEVKAVRSRRKGMAVFRLVDDDLPLISVGQSWSQGNSRGFVTEVKNGNVSVRIVSGTIRKGMVEVATTCHDPAQAIALATQYWTGFWKDESFADLQDPELLSMRDSLPALDQIDARISLYELQSVLKTLPVSKARGMDAVTNWELRHLCEDLQMMLLDLLNCVTSTGVWPKGLMRARMHLIRKTELAGDISSTRPICILPNVFRLWGKIMTSKCFKTLMPFLPPSLVGSIPGRGSTDLAMQLQISLENHLMSNQSVYGAALDLHKAFNTLDRGLLGILCQRLGLSKVWEPYERALSQMQRFFVIRNEWSQPVLSVTGVPEGCPLSVVMMAVTTWAVTKAVESKFAGNTLYSYVDDWTLRDRDPQDLLTQVTFVKNLTDRMGLKLSMTKTLMYATSGQSRKKLAKCMADYGMNLDVCDSGLSLGIEFQARGRRVTCIRDARVDKVAPLLNKLRVMPWPATRKAAVLTRGIFPSLFHGCEFHDMGKMFLRDARARSNGAVWKGKQYMSHYLSPILSTSICYEPWVWILRKCFMSFLRVTCLQPEQMLEAWNKAIGRPLTKHTLGPVTVFVAHLRRLGWKLYAGFRCDLPDRTTFRLDHLSSWQFKRFAISSWERWVVPKINYRDGLQELSSFSTEASTWDNEDISLNSFMMTLRSGGLFTNRAKAKFTGCSDKCILCENPDGMMHRVYDCSQAYRARHVVNWDTLCQLPPHSLVWGLFDQPEAQEKFWKALDELQTPVIQYALPEGVRHQLFTDGSCSRPGSAHRHEARAAWAVRLAERDSSVSTLLVSGPLPGRKQTAYRAEIYAVVNALVASRCSDIYTDCYNVYRGFLKLQVSGWVELHWRATPDIDLWRTLWRLLSEGGRSHCIYWTKAHRQVQEASCSHELWCILQNRSVDKSASVDNNPLPSHAAMQLRTLHVCNSELHVAKMHTARYMRALWDLHNPA